MRLRQPWLKKITNKVHALAKQPVHSSTVFHSLNSPRTGDI
jgi:hypothetical protein